MTQISTAGVRQKQMATVPIWALLFCSLFSILGCTNTPETKAVFKPRVGSWLMTLDLNGHLLPVDLEFTYNQNDHDVVFKNGEELIHVEDVLLFNDSIVVTMPLYDSKFIGKFNGPENLSGHWVNFVKGPDYKVAFSAQAGDQPRFLKDSDGEHGLVSGRWEVDFVFEENTTKAVGVFKQSGDHLTGTFLTETGDYRFLEGGVVDDEFSLSCFDGSHAFLFSGTVHNDSIVGGEFYSGTHWVESWTAVRNDEFELTNPDSLTSLKEGYDMIDFSIPDLNGRLVSPRDDKFKDKVLLVQIMGSWCPNCMDETALLCELYKERNNDGLEIVALAFEKHHNTPKAKERVQRMVDHHGVDYDVLMAGPASKSAATEQLLFLDNIMSYPTCIFIDRKGVVRKIRTGFYGPSTGVHYTEYVKKFRLFIDQLLSEEAGVLAGN